MNKGMVKVSVVWAEQERYLERQLWLPEGAVALEAVRRSGLLQELQLPESQLAGIGVWGQLLDGKRRPAADAYRVREGDRIELYRPLPMSPMELRRLRAGAKKSLSEKVSD